MSDTKIDTQSEEKQKMLSSFIDNRYANSLKNELKDCEETLDRVYHNVVKLKTENQFESWLEKHKLSEQELLKIQDQEIKEKFEFFKNNNVVEKNEEEEYKEIYKNGSYINVDYYYGVYDTLNAIEFDIPFIINIQSIYKLLDKYSCYLKTIHKLDNPNATDSYINQLINKFNFNMLNLLDRYKSKDISIDYDKLDRLEFKLRCFVQFEESRMYYSSSDFKIKLAVKFNNNGYNKNHNNYIIYPVDYQNFMNMHISNNDNDIYWQVFEYKIFENYKNINSLYDFLNSCYNKEIVSSDSAAAFLLLHYIFVHSNLFNIYNNTDKYNFETDDSFLKFKFYNSENPDYCITNF